MELDLTNDPNIYYTPGSGGHFLRHFLDPEITTSESSYWQDKAWHPKTGGGDGDETACPYFENSRYQLCQLSSENRPIKKVLNTNVSVENSKFTIGLGPVNYTEHIKIRVMVNTKNMHRKISQIDDIIHDIQINDIKLFTSPVTFLVNYTQLFNLEAMSELYLRANKEPVPEFKKKYFLDYKHKHDQVYYSWQYNVIEKICLFEYNNNCIEHQSSKMRSWSIDEIDEDNWQDFLEEKLCLTNYS